MKKRNDIVDKAIEALNKERVPDEPPSGVVDSTLGMLKEAQEQMSVEEAQQKRRIAEVLRTSGRFVRISAAAGIAVALLLCAVFIYELTKKPVPETALRFDAQPPEYVQQTEIEEETSVPDEDDTETITEQGEPTQVEMLLQMARNSDIEGLRQILYEGGPEVQLAAAFLLGKMGDEEGLALLQRFAEQAGAEPNEIRTEEQESDTTQAVHNKILKMKQNFKPLGVLSGLILDAETGEPVEGAEVQITKGQIYTQKTDVNGFYTFEDIEEDGNYRIGVWSDAYVGIYKWDEKPILNLSTEVNTVQHFELQPACMAQIQVVDEEGDPIEGAELLASWLGEEHGWEVGSGLYSSHTDANGFMFLGGFEPSDTPYLITALHYMKVESSTLEPGLTKRVLSYAPGKLVLRLDNPDIVETHEIVLRKGTDVRGYAAYSDGVPAAGLSIIAEPDWWHSTRVAPMSVIEPNSFFTLNHILEGTYNISIHFPTEGGGGMSYALQSLRLPPEEGLLSIRVPEKSPSSLVSISGTIDIEGLPTTDRSVHVSIDAYSKEHGHKSTSLWGNSNAFTIGRLEPGHYRLTFSGSNIESKTLENIPAPSEGLQVNLKYATKPRLRGTVLKADSGGEPVERFRARVRKLKTLRGPNYVQDNKWTEFRGMTGQFDVEVIGPGVYQVQADAEGFAPAWSNKMNTDVNDPVIIELSAGGAIKGVVVNESGELVSGAKVIPLSKASGTQPRVNNVFVSEAGAVETRNGRFTLEQLPAGKETLKVTHPDYSFQIVEDIEVTEGNVTEGVRITLSQGGAAEGYVYDGQGQPEANVTLYFQDDTGYGGSGDEQAGRFVTAVTDSNGFYRVEGLPEQMCYIRRSDSWSSQGVVRKTFLPSNGNVSRVDFGGRPYVGGALVVDGVPLASNRVQLGDMDSPHFGIFKCFDLTDSRGRFTFSGIPAGRYSIYYETPDKRNEWIKAANIDVINEDIDIGTIPERVSEIEGYILNDSNDPNLQITDVYVQEGTKGWGQRIGSIKSPKSPNDPYVVTDIFTEGPHTLSAVRADGVVLCKEFEALGAEKLTIEIPKSTSTLKGTIFGELKWIMMWRQDKEVVAYLRAGTDGRYEVKNLPAGEYLIGGNMMLDEGAILSVNIATNEDKDLDIDTSALSELPVTYLTVFAVDEDGIPIPAANMQLLRGELAIEPVANSKGGRYFISEPGEHTLIVSYPGYTDVVQQLVLQKREPSEDDLRMDTMYIVLKANQSPF